MKKTSLLTVTMLIVRLWLFPAMTGVNVLVAQESGSSKKTRRVPAMNTRVYDQLARAQAVADEGNVQEAMQILARVKDKVGSMNSYEVAMMHNFYGFIYYNADQIDKAIESFEQVIAQQPIPETFEQTTLFSLAQLSMAKGDYDKTVTYLNRWESLHKGKIPAQNLVLKAQAMYQKKDYPKASGYINEAIKEVENSEQGFKVQENWYVLQRAIYFELKQPKQVTQVLEKMVRLFNKPEYWVQLAGMYGELGEEKKQLAVMEAAYQQGYVTSGADMFNLAQLYYYHQVPYKGARLMEQAMQEGKLERNKRNLQFTANSWSFAKESEKAIPLLIAAAELAEDGELDAQLGQLYLNMDEYDKAISAATAALEKGGLRNQGMSHLVLGMAYFNQNRFVDAINALSEAEKHSSSKAIAIQWGRYVREEKRTQERLLADLSS